MKPGPRVLRKNDSIHASALNRFSQVCARAQPDKKSALVVGVRCRLHACVIRTHHVCVVWCCFEENALPTAILTWNQHLDKWTPSLWFTFFFLVSCLCAVFHNLLPPRTHTHILLIDYLYFAIIYPLLIFSFCFRIDNLSNKRLAPAHKTTIEEG